ncbi:rRNA (cytosine-C(5))-methyltransferase NOP2C [Ricinus communis]|uniref:RNA binding protein, putative n=1 Tax=Ricinus communis TaxID=3988 RepID=B9SPX7_RICCO|nr:rRNA (cytosine-C(5))-methyltransferase NOP2C [Ricinus communis]EEF34364.1 RNA binding protein, putative [Ricinus communis]|eukprot:XP_002528046.1 putative methyltransferase NSUN6 [Ricinus communis]
MKKVRDLLKTTPKTFLSFSTSASPSKHQLMDPSERYCFNPKLQWNPQVEDYFTKAYGPDYFSRISHALTRPPSYSCIRVNTLKTTADAVVEKLMEFVKETSFEDCSEAGRNDIEDRLCKSPITKCQIPGLDYVLFVKGSGPHMIDYGFSPGAPPKEVIVSRKCAEAVLRGAQVFVPGVMACSAHVEKGDAVAVSVAIEQHCPDGGWAIGMTRGTVLQGLPTDPYYFQRNGLYIGQGKTTMSRAGLFRVPEGIAVDMSNRVFKLPSFHDVLKGEIFLQNFPSIITAHALDPQKGERVLDMCAAPGGKTTAIAILMKNEGEIIACDRSHNKVLDIQKLAAEMSLTCITTYKLDALKAVRRKTESHEPVTVGSESLRVQEEKPSSAVQGLNPDKACNEPVSNEKEKERTYVSKADIRKERRRMRNGPGRNQCLGGRVENSKGFDPDSFDRVLLDAPCSALGLRPRLFAGEETVKSLRSHAVYQRRMFDQAVKLVRPGGVIVYSTCTINPGENEALVRYALDTYKFLSLAPQHLRVGGPGLVGSCEFPDGYMEEWLRPGEEELVQRFDPSSPLDTIGFFIAKFAVGTKDI